MNIRPVQITPPILGTAVRAFRMRAGMSIPELARACGYSSLAISKIENGTRKPTAGSARHILKVLGLSEEEVDLLVKNLNEPQQFGLKIREIRERTGVSLRDVARQVGISYASLFKIENGLIQPTICTALKITDALNLSEQEWTETMLAFLKKPNRESLIQSLIKEVFDQAGLQARYGGDSSSVADIVVSFGNRLSVGITVNPVKNDSPS